MFHNRIFKASEADADERFSRQEQVSDEMKVCALVTRFCFFVEWSDVVLVVRILPAQFTRD